MMYQIIIGVTISYCILFLLSIILKDNGIADIFWGIGFLQVAIHSIILYGNNNLSLYLFLSLIALWSFRITGYILIKRTGKREDARYAKWRKEWKFFYTRSFFQIYLLQGLLLLIVSIPLIIIISSIESITNYFTIGTVIALTGLIFETVADIQLYLFAKNKKKGEIMTEGLWHYSRHPNYFGESIFWLGIGVIGLAYSHYSLIGFITITILLRFVSGVPMAEERYKENENYKKYKRSTPAMIPNFFK